MKKAMKYITTPTLTKMLRGTVQATDLNLDPDGFHVLAWSMLHNDIEVRGWWMLKVQGTMNPQERMLTVPLAAFNTAMDEAREAV